MPALSAAEGALPQRTPLWNAPTAPTTWSSLSLASSTLTEERQLRDEALGYIYYYNNARERSALDYHTPYQALKAQPSDPDDHIRLPIPFPLDKVAVGLGPWSGYNVLAHYRKRPDFVGLRLTAPKDAVRSK